MSNVAPANPLEMLAYNLSLLIEDGQIVYVGTVSYTHLPGVVFLIRVFCG